MVGHQAIRPHRGSGRGTVPGQERAAGMNVSVVEEGPLAAVAALGNVLWTSWNNDAGHPGHVAFLRDCRQTLGAG